MKGHFFSLPLLHSYGGYKLRRSLSHQIQIDSVCDSECDLKTACGADEGAEGSCSGGGVGDSKASQLSQCCPYSKRAVVCVSALHVGMISKKALCKYAVNQSINRPVMTSCKSLSPPRPGINITVSLNTALCTSRLTLGKNNRTDVNVLALAVTRELRGGTEGTPGALHVKRVQSGLA